MVEAIITANIALIICYGILQYKQKQANSFLTSKLIEIAQDMTPAQLDKYNLQLERGDD